MVVRIDNEKDLKIVKNRIKELKREVYYLELLVAESKV